ncbi:hypothetical protein FZC35_01465 [Candidatus Cytomitobacter indipagum]|uniref:Type II/III secretion system secretin-like domain-containing protein n=1 Tax=Candidatus Cytomitobacter indipagum TaxID=2601575 RepID=A0A5C0UEB1_9PROT|nr:hypothetical protein [Candidatus Cytomitobacter indipagum]QEK38040.1 hypothetical protein FZC35_01465 [Candidatus Cytomitobacter indipagum]
MKYSLIICLMLFGCNKKLERPKSLCKELKHAKSNAIKKPKKKMCIPLGWDNKMSVTFADYSAIEILKKISEQSSISINISEELKDKKVFFSCKNISSLEAVKKLCALAGFRIVIQDSDIQIVKDEEYEFFHEIAFLSNVRSASTNTNVSAGCEKGGLNIGSSVNLSNKHDYDIWKEIESNLNFILGENNKKYTINKQAGVLIVRGKQRTQKQIHDFLMQVHKRASSQVLIEAKVLSVKLNHDLKTGINWNSLNLYRNIKNKVDWAVGSETQNSNALKIFTSQKSDDGEIVNDSLIDLLENFGEVSTVSNPTTTVLNNQYAIFKVAENQIYFNLKQSDLSWKKSVGEDKVLRAFSSEINTVPVGTMLSVQPSIDFRNRTITLLVHPTISDISHFTKDPAVPLMANDIKVESKVPIISTQEMDSTIRVDDGDLVVIGGLIKKRSAKEKEGIPGVRKVSVLGSTNRSEVYEEIVIMIRAYIVDSPEYNLISNAKDYELFKLNARK